jgi:hypothetical protein
MEIIVKNTERDISALKDSVTLVEKMFLVEPQENGNHTAETHGNVKRNIEHIKIMLEKDHIKTSTNDLSVFEKCVSDSESFLKNNTFDENSPRHTPKLN